jgi:hypothetical protein
LQLVGSWGCWGSTCLLCILLTSATRRFENCLKTPRFRIILD